MNQIVERTDNMAPGQSGRVFRFVQELAGELGKDKLELPSFPDVVGRLQAALTDTNASVKDIVAIISSDPVLSARLLGMANSAALNPAGRSISNINGAVTRLGFSLVRGTAAAYAIGQMRRARELEPIRRELENVWRASNEVASICYVVAKRAFGRQPDEAMLAGLLHQIGRLYILTHMLKLEPELRQDPAFLEVLDGWQAQVGGAILSAWGLPERIGEAVMQQDQLLGADPRTLPPLAKLLSAAKLRNRLAHEPVLREAHPDVDDTLNQLSFGERSFLDLVAAGQADIESMQQTLAA
jgi:HD-like signal output (HDOD) protein